MSLRLNLRERTIEFVEVGAELTIELTKVSTIVFPFFKHSFPSWDVGYFM